MHKLRLCPYQREKLKRFWNYFKTNVLTLSFIPVRLDPEMWLGGFSVINGESSTKIKNFLCKKTPVSRAGYFQ